MLWKKPSGIEIETQGNKETRAYCKSLGWKEISEKKKPNDDPIEKLEPVSDAEWDKPAKKSKK